MKRLKKILKWTAIVLGVLVAVLLIANAWFVWTTDARFERQLAAIRAAGDPLSLADLAHEPPPPETNAATYLRRAEADMAAITKELAKVLEATADPMRLPSAEEQKTIRAALDAYPKVVPLLQQAAACPDYDPELDYTLPPQSFHDGQSFMDEAIRVHDHIRPAYRVLRARAMLLAGTGDRDEAVRTALVILRLSRHFERNPVIVGYMLAMVTRSVGIDAANLALQAGPVSDEVRQALDAELARCEGTDNYRRAITSERAFGMDCFRTFPARGFWLLSRGVWNREESAYLDTLDAFVAVTQDPRPYRQVLQSIEEAPTGGPFGTLATPALQHLHEAVTRSRALARSLRVLNAIQARPTAPGDALPKLAELGLPPEATVDPYTGEALRVKRLPQGWLVYSVGKNFTDEGGKLGDVSDVGVGPPHVGSLAHPRQNKVTTRAGTSRLISIAPDPAPSPPSTPGS